MRRNFSFIFPVLFSLLFFSCEGAVSELVILHTNDNHGALFADSDGSGGLAARSSFIKQERKLFGNLLVLDAGDLNTGSALSDFFSAEPDILAYNMLGYDAVAYGNHEFDRPLSVLERQMELSRFSWLSANIKQGEQYLGMPYIVRDFDGIRVAIIGITTCMTVITELPDKSLSFLNELEAASEAVSVVKNEHNADIVILLTHLGDKKRYDSQVTSVELAQKVSGIDLIVDGHSHSVFSEPLLVNNVPIVTAGAYGTYMGEAILKIRKKHCVGFEWRLLEITEAAFVPDDEIASFLQEYKAAAEKELEEVLCNIVMPQENGAELTRYKVTATGRLVCDSLVEHCRLLGYSPDFAIINGGGIHGALPSGDITRAMVMKLLPFENKVVLVKLSGKSVAELFDFIGTIPQGAGGFAQFSSQVSYTTSFDENNGRDIRTVKIQGKVLEPDSVYTIATVDYLLYGGDGYTVLSQALDVIDTDIICHDMVTANLRLHTKNKEDLEK